MSTKSKISLAIKMFVVFAFFGVLFWARVAQQRNIAMAAPNSPRVYVSVLFEGAVGSSRVSVIDTGNNSVVTSIPVGISPFDVKISPDNSRAYVVNQGSNNISVIDTATNTVITTISLGSGSDNYPVSMSLSNTGSRLYTAQNGGDGNSVVVVDTSTNTVINTIPVGSWPTSLAAKPNSTLVYVAMADNQLKIVDTVTSSVNTVSVAAIYQGMIFNADGTRLYVTNDIGLTSVVDTSTNTEIVKLQVSPIRGNPILSSNEDALYTTGTTCAISVMDTSSNQWIESMPGVMQGGCGSIVVHPSRQRFYLSNTEAHTISVVNRSGNAVAIIPIGGIPRGLAIKP